jgi:ActR/RegA family two-component response regulator
VEDSKTLVERLAEAIREIPSIDLVGTAHTEASAIAFVRRQPIDVIILDLQLKQGTGFGVMRALATTALRPRILVMTNYDFLKRAKQRRQIIIATHNPNLAVVADAEQIIRVFIDKKNHNDFSFASGAIEDSNINTMVVDILEGTYPAFDNRRLKYRRR